MSMLICYYPENDRTANYLLITFAFRVIGADNLEASFFLYYLYDLLMMGLSSQAMRNFILIHLHLKDRWQRIKSKHKDAIRTRVFRSSRCYGSSFIASGALLWARLVLFVT